MIEGTFTVPLVACIYCGDHIPGGKRHICAIEPVIDVLLDVTGHTERKPEIRARLREAMRRAYAERDGHG